MMLLPLLLCCAIAGGPSAETGQVQGIVHDSYGAVVVGIRVAIIWNTGPGNAAEAQHTPDRVFTIPAVPTDGTPQGGYRANLIPGFYDVCIHGGGFVPQCKTVRIFAGKTAEYSPVMQTDKQIADEMRQMWERRPQ
jgi:hypothetical protein